jgi:DNA-binding MarR family transcriptional regulator
VTTQHGQKAAHKFLELYREIYRRYRRQDSSRPLTNQSRAVLEHFSQTGPLTVGEAARHLNRAQSVVSDIITQLEQHGLLEREPDPQDKRRTLVWLTSTGVARLQQEDQVLALADLTSAFATLDTASRTGLLQGMAQLIENAPSAQPNVATRKREAK